VLVTAVSQQKSVEVASGGASSQLDHRFPHGSGVESSFHLLQTTRHVTLSPANESSQHSASSRSGNALENNLHGAA